jgi:hypothetical protein
LLAVFGYGERRGLAERRGWGFYMHMDTTNSFIVGDNVLFRTLGGKTRPFLNGFLPSLEEALSLKDLLDEYLSDFSSDEKIDRINEKLLIRKRTKRSSIKSGVRPSVTNIYVMRNGSGHYKIGHTRGNPKFRENTLQSQEPEVELMFYFEGTTEDEKSLHTMFSEQRKRGEWFLLSGEDLEKIRDYFKNKKTP